MVNKREMADWLIRRSVILVPSSDDDGHYWHFDSPLIRFRNEKKNESIVKGHRSDIIRPVSTRTTKKCLISSEPQEI